MIAAEAVLKALPIAVYTTDADGRITFFNEAAAALWGHRPEIGDLWCGSWRLFSIDGSPLPHDECPMAIALKEGREPRGVEAIAERPDGTRFTFVPYPTLLRDADGRVTGALNVLVDVSDRKNAEIEAGRLAAIVSSSDDVIVSKSLDGKIATWNASAERVFGYTAEEAIGKHISLIIPPELHSEETHIIGKIRAGERVEHFDTVRVAKDGRKVEVSLTVSPVRDSKGRVIGASKVARDVTERKETERLQRLLFEELNHRVKNTLAIIQSLAVQSLRRTSDPREFVSSFNGRIQALGRAHDLLVNNKMRGAELSEIVREQALLGAPPDGTRILCAGPRVQLDSRTSVQLGLVVHELATNARKYGALATPSGRLDIRWTLEMDDDHKTLNLQWRESGVPSVSAPQDCGFGTTLIERSLQVNGGTATLRYAADGLSCEISLPLPIETEREIATEDVLTSPAAASYPERAAGELAGKRVLVIEDEPLVAMDIEAVLSTAECVTVGPAGTLAEAKRLMDAERFDAAIVDANLGGTRVDEIASVLTRRGVPFVFASGYGRGALPEQFSDRPLVAKPFSAPALLATLESVLAPELPDRKVIAMRRRNRPSDAAG